MGTKTNPSIHDCYAKARDDEPMFILLGRDPQAATLVLRWAQGRERLIDIGEIDDTPHERAKVEEARKIARDMADYRDNLKVAAQPGPQNAPVV